MGGKLASPARLMTPGPGAYSPTSSMLHAAPRYSLSPRRNHIDHMAFVPGPGAYDPNNPAHKPRGVAVGQKINVFAASTVTPGPAAYNVDELTAFNRGSGSNIGTKGGKRGAPSYSFGLKAGNGAMGTVSGTPGPGAYSPSPKSVHSTGQSLSYSMTARGGKCQSQYFHGFLMYSLPSRRGFRLMWWVQFDVFTPNNPCARIPR